MANAGGTLLFPLVLALTIPNAENRIMTYADDTCKQLITTDSVKVFRGSEKVKIYFYCDDTDRQGRDEDGRVYEIYRIMKCGSVYVQNAGIISDGLLKKKKYYCMSCYHLLEPKIVPVTGPDSVCVFTDAKVLETE